MFQFIIPEILLDARSLSMGAVTIGLVLGIFLWLFGWWSHRFWVVLITTVMAGIVGLYESSAFQAAEPLLAGLLLALAAGLLALALVRVLAFLAGGLVGLWAVQSMVPTLTQSLICFLLCGIMGLALFRVWMMGITSLAGTLLATYCTLSLLDRAGSLDAVTWTAQGTILLNWATGFLAVLGVGVQYYLDRRRRRKKDSGKKKEVEKQDSWDDLSLSSWTKYRKAG